MGGGDNRIYLVGSEEGPIYKCDRSYSEQYMMTYLGHNGPVYQVRLSHFLPLDFEHYSACNACSFSIINCLQLKMEVFGFMSMGNLSRIIEAQFSQYYWSHGACYEG